MRSLIFMLLVSGLLCVPFAIADDPPEPEAMCDYDVLIYWGTLGNPPHTFWISYFCYHSRICHFTPPNSPVTVLPKRKIKRSLPTSLSDMVPYVPSRSL
jgi:hypothetical protein